MLTPALPPRWPGGTVGVAGQKRVSAPGCDLVPGAHRMWYARPDLQCPFRSFRFRGHAVPLFSGGEKEF